MIMTDRELRELYEKYLEWFEFQQDSGFIDEDEEPDTWEDFRDGGDLT